MTRAGAAVFSAALLFGPQRDAAPPLTPALGGRVVAAATGDPIRNARVAVSTDRYVAPVLTDNAGRFTIVNLPARRLTLTASKPGFAKASPLVVAAGQDPIVIALQLGAAVSGVVLDDAGEPVPNASVMLEPPEARY